MRMLEISQLSLRYAQTRIRRPSQRARLAAAIAQQGQLSPVLVHAEGERFVLVDGYARVEALQDLGQDLVHALVLEMSPSEALLTAHRLRGGRRPTAIEDGWLLRVLIDEHGLRSRDLATKLERSSSWVSRRLALVEVLPERVQEAIRRVELCPQAAMKSLVPLARANAEHCERLVTALNGEAPSVRDLDRLYRAWRAADPSVRERIVNQPQLFLRAAKVATPECGLDPSSPVGQLIELRQLAERIASELEAQQPDHQVERLREAWKGARHAFDALEAQLATLHARRRDSDHHSSTLQDGPGQTRHREDPPNVTEHRPCDHRNRRARGPSISTQSPAR